MKILFVNTYYDPNMFGGAEHSVKMLAEGLSDKYECAIFSVDTDCNEGLKIEKIGKLSIFRSGSNCFDYAARFHKNESKKVKLKNRLADLYNPVALKHFELVLQLFKPEIIHSNGIRGIGPQIWKIANKNQIKVVHTLRDYFVVDPTMKMKHLKLFFAWKCFFAHYSKYIDCLTAPSNFTISQIIKLNFGKSIKKCLVVPNGTDVDLFEEIFQKKLLKKGKKTRFFLLEH